MFKNNADFNNLDKQTSVKKIVSFFIDFLLTAVLGLISVILITTPAIKNSKSYKNNYSSLIEASKECYNYQSDAKLSIKKSDEEIFTDDELFDKYANAQIKLAYTYHTNEFNSSGVAFESLEDKATFENDLIGYYYSTYKVENNILVDDLNGKTGKEYFISIISESDISSYFEFHENELPSLNVEVSKSIFNYLNKAIDSSNYYDNLKNFFLVNNHKALQELSSFAPYKVHYDNFLNSYYKINAQQVGSLVLTYTILFVVAFVLPSVLSGNGVTLGRLLTHSRCAYKKNPILSKILDLVMTYILLFSTVGFIGLFSFGMSCLGYTFLGPINLLIIVFITLILLIADLVVTSFVPKNLSLTEICSLETIVYLPKRTMKEEFEDEKN